MSTGLPRPGLARSAHRGRITLLRGYVSKSSATLNPLTITQLASKVAQSGHPVPLPSRFHFNRVSTSIDLPLPSVFHFHRSSTSIGLPLSRPLTCCNAHAQTRLHALAFCSSLSLCMPAPMASRFSSSASGVIPVELYVLKVSSKTLGVN